MNQKATATLYVGEGLIILFGNLLVVLAVLLRKALRKRKELLIIVGLCFGDGALGLAYTTSGLRRLYFLQLDRGLWTNYTSFECYVTTPMPLLLTSAQCMCVMMMVVSADRYMAVTKPAYYMGLTPQYVYKAWFLVYVVFGLGTTVAAGVSSFLKGDRATGNPICSALFGVSKHFFVYHIGVSVVTSTVACIMYLGVVVKLKPNKTEDMSQQSQLFLNQKRRQIKVAKLLMFVVATTFVFFCMPYSIFALMFIFRVRVAGLVGLIGTYFTVLAGVNSILNASIFIFHHRDIRNSAFSLLTYGIFSETDSVRAVDVRVTPQNKPQPNAVGEGQADTQC